MTLTPVTFERFGGLNLRDDPFEIGAAGATVMNNVDLVYPGRISCRSGYADWLFAAAAKQPQDLAMHRGQSSSKLHLLAYTQDSGTADGTLHAYSRTGTSVDSITHSKSGALFTHTSFASIGTLSATLSFAIPWCYDPNPTGTSTFSLGPMFQWTGTAWSDTGKTGAALAAWPGQSRLAKVKDAVMDTVEFSDAGTPTTFGANNFVTLDPGNGERIIAIVGWADQLFVFKQSVFYVFYAVSTDADGEPVFNYRAVRSNVGVGVPNCAVAAPDGVYFLHETGVYRTAGGTPQKVSGPLDPLFTGTHFLPMNQTAWTSRMAYNDGRIYLSMPVGVQTTPTSTLLVYDIKGDYWMSWNIGTRGLASLLVDGRATLMTSYTSTKQIRVHGPLGPFGSTRPDDAGGAISWSYTSGRYPLADPGQVGVVQESSLVGTGTVTLDLDSDLYSDQSGTATLGDPVDTPDVAEGWVFADQEGTWMQFTLSGSVPAVVSRMTHYVSSAKPVSVR